ncbi:MAG: RsmB/NOP family class I SAM-dependent RNA methyltransferase, partial [Pseudomonadota bacterium]
GPLAPTCLRVLDGARRVSRSAAYADGLVELQDAASQAAAAHANAAPGMIVLDYCAGGGGKALALAAHMAGRGRLMAHDIDPARMADLPARARRAGAAISPVGTAGLPELADRCDLVFADAPCSGSGAWRRNPDARWRLTPHRLAELHDAQNTVLAGAAACVRPGGTLVYATCSVLHSENIERVRAFLSGNTGWNPEREPLSLLPSGTDGDGFFAIRLVKGVQD